MNLRPRAIYSPFCRFLRATPLSVTLPAEKEAPGYAENKIRYSNMSTRSPTSSCIFRGQPSPVFIAGDSDISDRDCVRENDMGLAVSLPMCDYVL